MINVPRIIYISIYFFKLFFKLNLPSYAYRMKIRCTVQYWRICP